MQKPLPERTIRVLWLCNQGSLCSNREHLGTHDEYDDCAACRGIRKLAPIMIPEPVLIVGRNIPILVGAD